MSGRKLVFQGHRWPAADAQGGPVLPDLVFSDGTLLQDRSFVEIATTGDGRAWTPEPVDATWRDLAELDLADPDACEAFARRRGDPSGALSAGKPQSYVSTVSRHGVRGSRPVPAVPGRVVTIRWWPLVMALQQAVRGWMPPDELGVSYPVRDQKQRTEAWRFLDQPVFQAAMQKVKVAPDPDSLAPAFTTSELDVFLIMQAWLALEHPLPMTRCQVCNSWFEIRRPNRAPRYCSASCRAIHHQQQQKETLSHGIGTQEHHAQRDAPLADGVERARSGRQHAPTHKELRAAKRGTRARSPHGAGDRRPRRR